MALLEVNGLQKSFGAHRAVDNISFEIEQGKIFGLLGPNGAGKSTLLRMVTGIFYPDAGTVSLNGKMLNGLDKANLIGYMPEERGLYRKMKIGEQIIYLARLKGLSEKEAKAKAQDWFQRLGMETWWNKTLEDLSKGMGQKLQFVASVIHDPILLILDEPFSGLDPVNANVIKDEIYRLAKLGTTIIFSTHRMEQVEEICDHIVLINQGQKLVDGTVKSIKHQYKDNHYVLETVAPITQIPEWLTVDTHVENRITFHAATPELVNQVLRFYMDAGMQIVHFNEMLPSLNDIFIKLVGDAPTARVFAD